MGWRFISKFLTSCQRFSRHRHCSNSCFYQYVSFLPPNNDPPAACGVDIAEAALWFSVTWRTQRQHGGKGARRGESAECSWRVRRQADGDAETRKEKSFLLLKPDLPPLCCSSQSRQTSSHDYIQSIAAQTEHSQTSNHPSGSSAAF